MTSQPSTLSYQLLQHFDTLAETAGAVAKLRTLVLELAIKGRLFPEMKTKLVRLGEVIDLISGQHLLAHEHNNRQQGIPYLTGPSDFGPKQPVPTRWTQKPKVIAEPGDILITVKGSGVGKTNRLSTERTAIGRQLMAVRVTKADSEFVHLVLLCAESHFQSAMTGIAIPGIGRKDILDLAVSLPPQAEQRRIVAKVEELLALCDELAAAQAAAREHRTDLVRSALDHLSTAQTEPEFRQHAAFILQHSDLVLDSVSALRQAIFSLAVQGKLLPQNAKQDGTAEQALNERHRHLKSNGTTRKKSLLEFPAVDDASIPMPLPENWNWIRFGEVADRLEYGTSEKSFANENGVPTLRMGNVQDGKLDFGNLKYVPYECADLPTLFLDDGDIIFNRTNSAELVGKAAVFRGKPKSFTLASYLIRVSLDENVASPDFFNLVINSSYFRRTQIEPELTQQCGQANFSGSKLANSIVPLPPLAEQQRIVAKVDELMGWCDALESRLTAAQTTAASLLDATLHQLLAA